MKSKLENFIADNSEQLDSKEPNPEVLNRILAQMQPVAAQKQTKGVVISFRMLRWATAAVVVLVCGIAFYTMQQHNHIEVVAVNPPVKKIITRVYPDSIANEVPGQTNAPARPDTRNRDAVDREIAQRKNLILAKLNSDNRASRKLMMLTGLRDMDSPAKRITALAQASDLKMAGRDITSALLNTLNNDPNVNVRLAALDGLARFYRETYIRKQLISSLKTQQNPTVQIALIELLTRMKEAAVLAQLDKIVASDSTMTAVKDCAYSGILKLRKS